MTTLKQQLEQWIERETSNRFKSHQLMTAHLYKAGAHSILPMLLVAVEAIEEYSDLHHAPKLEETLNKIKSMMEGNGNDTNNISKLQI